MTPRGLRTYEKMTYLVTRRGKLLDLTYLDRFSVIKMIGKYEVLAVFKVPIPGFGDKAHWISYKVLRWFSDKGRAQMYCNGLKSSIGW